MTTSTRPRPRCLTAPLARLTTASLAVTTAAALAAVAPLLAQPAAAAQHAATQQARPVPAARPAPATGTRAGTLPAGVRQVCSTPAPGAMACLALLAARVHAGARTGPLSTTHAYSPADLQSAYALATASAARGGGETVAIVDAYDDPDAAANLAAYRKHWKLPGCDTTTGAGCLAKVNQSGVAAPLPGTDPSGGWELEESVDLDMVSAVCPRCHLLLVEARSSSAVNLSRAEDTAVHLGAKFVSDSWGGADVPALNAFDHPGVAITVAAGDFAGVTSFPASSQLVTSVGGTTLRRDPGTARGWQESVWHTGGFFQVGTGAGCTGNPVADAQPSWQAAVAGIRDACPNRVDNDVAAVANPATPVWAYDTYPYEGQRLAWTGVGGTSVASPIVASVYALAGTPAPGSYPASYLYQPGHAAHLNDVTTGRTGTCVPALLCTAGPGYDGPSGWGTPAGTAAFASPRAAHVVTVVNPGTRDYPAGSVVMLPVQAAVTGGAQGLSYAASGLPAGLSVNAATGVISGRMPSRGGTSTVQVAVSDAAGARGAVAFQLVSVPDLLAAYHPVTGIVRLQFRFTHKCLDDTGGGTGNGTKVQIWSCNGRSASQDWTYVPDGQPDGAGTLQIHGKCLDIAGNGLANASPVQLDGCDGRANQQWSLQYGAAWLWNPASGKCLNAPGWTRNGIQADLARCADSFRQLFLLPPGPVMSGVAGLCLTDPGDSHVKGTPARVDRCSGHTAQKWNTFSVDNESGLHGGLCLATLTEQPGAAVTMLPCFDTTKRFYNLLWFPLSDGEIVSGYSNLCLDDPNSGASGTALKLAVCAGQLGEIWAVS